MMGSAVAIRIQHFSDLLCVWAYVAQRRVDELLERHGDAIELEYHHFSVFGSVRRKLERGWSKRGGAAGYRAHIAELEARFEHLEVHPKLWIEHAPESSVPAHVFVAAVRLCGADQAQRMARCLREAFFRDGRDISRRSVQLALAEQLGLPSAELEGHLDSGRAHALWSDDVALARDLDVRVSPSLVFNEGRQRLIGNVGYRVIEANVRELLQGDAADQASWC